MKTVVHLVSMPVCETKRPSIQLGCLQAYLDSAFGETVPVHSYSAFFGIMVLERGSNQPDGAPGLFDQVDGLEDPTVFMASPAEGEPKTPTLGERHSLGEAPYFLIYAQKYLRQQLADFYDESLPFGGMFELSSNIRAWCHLALGGDGLRILRERTDAYIESRIVPRLIRDGINVVGFSCTFNQTYASAYCQRYLQERCPDHKFVFVFGGSSIGMPGTQKLLKHLELDAYCVVGEGEAKIETLVRQCLADEPIGSVGVVHVRDPIDFYSKQQQLYDGQIEKLDSLPVPQYDEYYAELRDRCRDEAHYAECMKGIEIPLEGSRGCAFACTFCNLNYLWDGYRQQSAEQVLEKLAEAQRRYGVPGTKVRYMDNLCNWSASMAKVAEEKQIELPIFMELRARYPEEYFVRLVRRGVWLIQIGYEAFSTDLLALMEKKTVAIDNVKALKYTSELGIGQLSNMIMCYPASTIAMVQETWRVLEHVKHMSSLNITEFLLVEGSPLYNRLPRETKERLQPAGDIQLHPALRSQYVASYVFDLPDELQLEPDVRSAWLEVWMWYSRSIRFAKTGTRPRFTVEPIGDKRSFVDTRSGTTVEYTLDGAAARVVDVCHRGLSMEALAEAASISLDEAKHIVADLESRKTLLFLDGRYITVALRPKVELLAAYDKSPAPTPPRPVKPRSLSVVL